MQVWKEIKRLIKDPPPRYAFEISSKGLAHSEHFKTDFQMGFRPLGEDVLSISPLKDNVLRADVLFQEVRAVAPQNGKKGQRTAALILPDYCARVAVLDFEDLPSDQQERDSLVRFRLKKSIPFDIESARVDYHVQANRSGAGKYEVVAAAAALEIVARYEAAFRAAQFQLGFVTTSMLAALNLLGADGVRVVAKLSGSVLTAAVTEDNNLRLLRCIELPRVSQAEVSAILYPTFAYVEDTFGNRASSLLLCGFGDLTDVIADHGRADLGVRVEQLRSRLGEPDGTNAGLLGYLEAIGE